MGDNQEVATILCVKNMVSILDEEYKLTKTLQHQSNMVGCWNGFVRNLGVLSDNFAREIVDCINIESRYYHWPSNATFLRIML